MIRTNFGLRSSATQKQIWPKTATSIVARLRYLLYRPVGNGCRGGGGRRVNGEEEGVAGTPATDSFSDHTGRSFSFTAGVPLQAQDVRGERKIDLPPWRGNRVLTRSRNMADMLVRYLCPGILPTNSLLGSYFSLQDRNKVFGF